MATSKPEELEMVSPPGAHPTRSSRGGVDALALQVWRSVSPVTSPVLRIPLLENGAPSFRTRATVTLETQIVLYAEMRITEIVVDVVIDPRSIELDRTGQSNAGESSVDLIEVMLPGMPVFRLSRPSIMTERTTSKVAFKDSVWLKRGETVKTVVKFIGSRRNFAMACLVGHTA